VLYFIKEKAHILTGSLLNFRSYVDVGDGGPREEKVIEKLHKIQLANSV
jgi:hypothetical protein